MESADREYAERLQRDEDRAAMMDSDSGKAVLLVEGVISIVKSTNEAYPSMKEHKIEAVAYDDMVWFAKHLMGLQREYARSQLPTEVDTGYHYTHESNLPRIRTHGLLTKGDRKEKKVTSEKTNGSVFGDGIYTANNPTSFASFGDVGLIVGRLKGKELKVTKTLSTSAKVDAKTVIGDKLSYGIKLDSSGWPVDDRYNECVLRTSNQCLPMIRYDAALQKSIVGRDCLLNMEKALGVLLDKFFNNSEERPADYKSPAKTFAVPAPSVGTSFGTKAASPGVTAWVSFKTQNTSPFGGTPVFAAAALSPFSSGKSPFGTPAAPTESKSPFGAPAASPFGAPPAAAAPSPFGSTSSGAFGTGGSLAPSPSPFGGSSGGSAFGGGAPAAATPFSCSGAFGSVPAAAGSAFGQAPAASAAPKFGGRSPRDILVSFYQTHNPSKLNDVDKVLTKYAGKEEQLFLNLANKYNLDPIMFGISASQPAAAAPTGGATFGSPAAMGMGGGSTGFGAPSSGFGASSGFAAAAQGGGGGFGSLASSPAAYNASVSGGCQIKTPTAVAVGTTSAAPVAPAKPPSQGFSPGSPSIASGSATKKISRRGHRITPKKSQQPSTLMPNTLAAKADSPEAKNTGSSKTAAPKRKDPPGTAVTGASELSSAAMHGSISKDPPGMTQPPKPVSNASPTSLSAAGSASTFKTSDGETLGIREASDWITACTLRMWFVALLLHTCSLVGAFVVYGSVQFTLYLLRASKQVSRSMGTQIDMSRKQAVRRTLSGSQLYTASYQPSSRLTTSEKAVKAPSAPSSSLDKKRPPETMAVLEPEKKDESKATGKSIAALPLDGNSKPRATGCPKLDKEGKPLGATAAKSSVPGSIGSGGALHTESLTHGTAVGSSSTGVGGFSFGAFGSNSSKMKGKEATKGAAVAASSKETTSGGFSFGAFSEEERKKAPSSSAFPPMSAAAPKKPTSNSAFPRMAAAAPKPFGASAKKEENKASSSSAFPLMTAATPKNPFSDKPAPSSVFPPMAAAAPKPFGASSFSFSATATSKSASPASAFPLMTAVAPNPFVASVKKEKSMAADKTSNGPSTMNFAPQTLSYCAPLTMTGGIPSNALSQPPMSCNMDDDCVVCHDKLSNDHCVALARCGHTFHSECIEAAFKSKPQCPVCRVSVGEPRGKSPTGTMEMSFTPSSCSGFQGGSITIKYDILSGTQRDYHENPGTSHAGKTVTAYLPNIIEGRDLLKRFAYAFMHGLTFTVGTSITTGKNNQCTWASIHHKTSTKGGVKSHGFPDDDYFVNCNSELDSLGVPPASALDYSGKECNP